MFLETEKKILDVEHNRSHDELTFSVPLGKSPLVLVHLNVHLIRVVHQGPGVLHQPTGEGHNLFMSLNIKPGREEFLQRFLEETNHICCSCEVMPNVKSIEPNVNYNYPKLTCYGLLGPRRHNGKKRNAIIYKNKSFSFNLDEF